MTVNIALRRQLHQLEYYTEGSVPEALIGVPETWTPDQIGQFQAYWDALLEGDTAQRRHARFVPATISKSFVQTKDGALKDEYDEWLARIICYAFAVAPGSLTRDNNRATADFQHSQALQEGLLPLMRWVKALVDRSIAEHFEAMVNEAIRNPDYVRPRPGGGVYLYNRRLDLIVIVDPSSADNGTAFRHIGGATGARKYVDYYSK